MDSGWVNDQRTEIDIRTGRDEARAYTRWVLGVAGAPVSILQMLDGLDTSPPARINSGAA